MAFLYCFKQNLVWICILEYTLIYTYILSIYPQKQRSVHLFHYCRNESLKHVHFQCSTLVMCFGSPLFLFLIALMQCLDRHMKLCRCWVSHSGRVKSQHAPLFTHRWLILCVHIYIIETVNLQNGLTPTIMWFSRGQHHKLRHIMEISLFPK